MAIVNIGDQEYDSEDFSDDAKVQLAALQATDLRIKQLNQDLAAFQTARNAYAAALTELLQLETDG